MIAIVDNGGAYSDHAIYFVEVPAEHVGSFEVALPVANPKASILGFADRVDWREDTAQADTDFYNAGDFLAYNTPPEPEPKWQTIAPAYRARLIAAWKKRVADQFAQWRDVEAHLRASRMIQALEAQP